MEIKDINVKILGLHKNLKLSKKFDKVCNSFVIYWVQKQDH